MLANLALGLSTLLTPMNAVYMIIGTCLGIMAGAIPGLSATMAISLLVPVTFVMEPLSGLAMLAGIYNGGMFGGSISSVLFNVPGAASAAVTAFDGYPMTKKGQSARALQLSVLASFVGGTISVLALLLMAPALAKVVLMFGPAEYFWVAIFGLSIVVSLSSQSMIKGLLSGLLGLLAAQVGMDPVTAFPRFTFDNIYLSGGFLLTAVLLGMFSVPEAISLLEKKSKTMVAEQIESTEKVRLFSCFKPYWLDYLISSIVGVIVGVIPAAGGNIASFVSYDVAKKRSKHPEKFGTGIPEGVIASEAANNGCTGGSFVPLLTMGIPGSPAAAAIRGAFMVHGLVLGPQLFTGNPEIIYGLMWAMFLTNFVMLFAGFYGAKVFRKALSLPKEVLSPLILVFCILGVYSMRGYMFDVAVMLGFGVVAFIMKKFGYSSAAFILGFILSPLAEKNMLRTLKISNNSISGFFNSPLSFLMITITVISVVAPIVIDLMKKKKAASQKES